MSGFRTMGRYVFGIVLLGACQRGHEADPATPAVPAGEPSAMPEPAPATPEATPEASASMPPGVYPMCGGQHVAVAADASRSGAVSVQLAPAFLDEMVACKPEDGLPKDAVGSAGAGHINAKGDCEFANAGITCHYHSGSEFITKVTSHQSDGQGELHCIVPSGEPKSPHVYGGHVVCRQHDQGQVHGQHAAHEIKEGASCSSAILAQLGPCNGFRCCDDGTLTNPIGDLTRDGRNDVRPDFRICSDTLEVDCDLLANLTPHTANSPALGGVAEPVFAVTPSALPSKTAAKHPTH